MEDFHMVLKLLNVSAVAAKELPDTDEELEDSTDTLSSALPTPELVERRDCELHLHNIKSKMAGKLLGLDKLANLFRIIRENGGPLGCLRTLYRQDDLKMGTLVGEDKFGNRYYENNYYFYGRNRWVMYADKVWMDYDGSQVPAEWFGWLHYKTDLPPHKDPTRPKYKWMAEHTPNMTATKNAYMPYSTTPPKIEPWKPS